MRMWLVWVLVTVVKVAVAVVLGIVLGWGWLVVVLGLACVSTVLAVVDLRRHGARSGAASVRVPTDAAGSPGRPRASGSEDLFGSVSDTGPLPRAEARHRRVGRAG